MDINKATNEIKLQLCSTYYRAGFALLPLVWIVNVCWFYSEAFKKPPFEEQKQIKKYVIYSFIGATIWIALVAAWVTVFQLHRAEWGATADYMSFIIPLGKA